MKAMKKNKESLVSLCYCFQTLTLLLLPPFITPSPFLCP